MNVKKPSALRCAVSGLLIVCAFALFCTSAEAAEDPGLRETPGLVTISLSERRREYRSWSGGSHLCSTKAGNFFKIQISGKGGETVGFFLHAKDSDEARGAWIPLDGQVHELWIQVPEDGTYWLAEFPDRDDYTDYYAYTQFRYDIYSANGEPWQEPRRGGGNYNWWHTSETVITERTPAPE